MVGIGVGGGSRRSGEEEAGGLGRRQHHPLVAARLVTGGVCVCMTIHTYDDGSAAQECVFLRAQRASLRHTAAGIPQGGGGVCGGGGAPGGGSLIRSTPTPTPTPTPTASVRGLRTRALRATTRAWRVQQTPTRSVWEVMSWTIVCALRAM